MKQNKYDDPDFFAAYAAMPRSVAGLAAAGEWETLRAMLPDFAGKRVLDLGCGFGWHCRYARDHGATHVVGIDLSEKMLARAAAENGAPGIAYRRGAIEDVAFAPASFDVVLSSLAFHYVRDLDAAVARVADVLAPGGSFVFSTEHPVFTAMPGQDWERAADGSIRHWPVDAYQMEGERKAHWLGADVVKYHRTLETWVRTLLAHGFRITGLAEPKPPEAMIAERPDMADELRRPMFLLVSAVKEG